MLSRNLLRTAFSTFALPISRRYTSTMATPLSSFSLDHNIFKGTLYSRLTDFWFRDVAPGASAASKDVMMRWYGAGSDEVKTAFDSDCRKIAQEALIAISPERLSLPEFQSHEDDKEKSADLAAPFITEVTKADKPSDVLLALTILLDQMPRNIFRDQETLPRVYNHYDRLALALIRNSMKTSSDPLAPFKGRPVVRMWFYMPLMHSEDVTAHEQWRDLIEIDQRDAQESGDEAACKLLESFITAENQHFEALEKFGRYPHRNECLGRKTTAKEEEYLNTGMTFGVKQSSTASKDEL